MNFIVWLWHVKNTWIYRQYFCSSSHLLKVRASIFHVRFIGFFFSARMWKNWIGIVFHSTLMCCKECCVSIWFAYVSNTFELSFFLAISYANSFLFQLFFFHSSIIFRVEQSINLYQLKSANSNGLSWSSSFTIPGNICIFRGEHCSLIFLN